MLVFRASGQRVPGERLRLELLQELRSMAALHGDALRNLAVSALLRAGELECALEDAASPAAHLAAQVTDQLAHALLDPPQILARAARAEKLLGPLTCPETLEVFPPEGFCFYALHPLNYAVAMRSLDLGHAPVAVVGIRSIGSTLSAVVSAAAEKVGFGAVPVDRITVRPEGHPFARSLELNPTDTKWVNHQMACGARFVVVDEGPGLSGSSFLAVAEALAALGVPEQNIHLLCSHAPDLKALCATNAEERWSRFRTVVAGSQIHAPAKARKPMHGGDWRDSVFNEARYELSCYTDARNWPAVWATMSVPRLLSEDGTMLYKFEGLGRYGAAVLARAALIGEAEFGPPATDAGDGFTCYPMLRGRLLSTADLCEPVLERMARYIAFRAEMLPAPAEHAQAGVHPLGGMARHNFRQLTGKPLDALQLVVERPMFADARMMPHEWLRISGEGRIVKLDSASHGDNHFFPGPVDVAWDIAGAIIEWEMQPDAVCYFLSCYEDASGDAVAGRLLNYMVAYAAFQGGYAMMAASAMAGTPEQKLFLRDAMRYRASLVKLMQQRPRHAQVA